jgi:hypothetical protein
MDACLAGDWDFGRRCHQKLMQFELDHITPLRTAGHLHGIISKARASLSGFLEDNGQTRAPYYPVSSEQVAMLQQAFDRVWKEEIERESFNKLLEGSRS